MSDFKDVTGSVGSAKYMYQAHRVGKGLSSSTKLTAAIDLIHGGTGLTEAAGIADVAKSTSTVSKGVTGAAKVSKFAKVAGYASKAAPVLAKGSCVLGAALGGYEIGSGINEITKGNTSKGRDKVISGSADVVTAGALAVAATSAGTVVGLPVSAVALGVAGVAQAGKYAYKHRGSIAAGAKWAGNKISQGWNGLKSAFSG